MIIPINSDIPQSMKAYLQVLNPVLKLKDKEIEVLSSFLSIWHSNRSNPNLDKTVFQAVHYHHPSAVWARETKAQYEWLYSLFVELGKEYTYRYGGKILSTNALLNDILKNEPENIKQEGWREPPPAMKDFPQ